MIKESYSILLHVDNLQYHNSVVVVYHSSIIVCTFIIISNTISRRSSAQLYSVIWVHAFITIMALAVKFISDVLRN